MVKKISATYYSTDWTADLSDRHSVQWNKGIKVIKERFESRFLNPAQVLIDHPDKSIKYNCGFLIMSIDCLLIETLNQFYLGLKKTTDKYYIKNADANFKYNWQAFRDFFQHSTYFPDFKSSNDLTKVFFDEIRCGLLHQAESKTNSLINLKKPAMVVPLQVGDYSQGVEINRRLFHNAVKDEFNKYISDLVNADSKNLNGDYLRTTCNAKMIALCT